jgi:valyl-tRNA synthetase
MAGGKVPGIEAVSVPIDFAMLSRLSEVLADASSALESYDYARALERTEAFFWSFCDDYLELVKARAYEPAEHPEPASARAALAAALSVQLRMFAPFLPFVTEEVWSWWHRGSVHRAPWPMASELPRAPDSDGAGTAHSDTASQGATVLEVAAYVLGEVRRAKTAAKRSMRVPVARLTVVDEPTRLSLLAQSESDLRQAGHILELVTRTGPPDIKVELAPDEQVELTSDEQSKSRKGRSSP